MSHAEYIHHIPEATLRRAVSILNDQLKREAESRDWCDEYNEFVERVNRLADVHILERRIPRRKRVGITMGFEVEASYDLPLTDELWEMMRENAPEFNIEGFTATTHASPVEGS